MGETEGNELVVTPQRGHPPTLRDVAERAGVHPSTVSRVLSATGFVRTRPETIERIHASARELGYRPNAIARGLRLQNVGALGLLLPSLRNPVLASITRGAYARAWERDFVVVIAEDSEEGGIDQALYDRLVREGRIDGLLVASARPRSPLLERLEDAPFPYVFVNRAHPGSGRNVVMREEDAGTVAAEHLLELGHERLGHVAGPADLDTARRRADGFVTRVAEAGLQTPVVHAPFTEEGGFGALQELLAARERPTAVFVSNINQAIGAIAAARAEGLSVPRELSIIGYDDDPVGRFLDPPLTAIRMPLGELGATAADALIEQIRGDDPRDIVVNTAPVLVPLESTGPAPV